VSEPLFEVLDGGLLTTVQDAGRPDWTHLGVPESDLDELSGGRPEVLRVLQAAW